MFNISERLVELREQRSDLLAKANRIIEAAERAGRSNPSHSQEGEYQRCISQAKSLGARIERLERSRDEGASVTVLRDADEKREKGWSFARCVRALAATKGNVWAAADYAERTLEDSLVGKALAAGAGSAGGFTIPEPFVAEFIELLRPVSAVRALNPILIPLPRGNATMRGLGSGVSVGYIGENQNIPKTEPTFRQVKLSAKKLAALVPISNDLIRFGTPATDTLVRDELLAAISQAEDATFIRSQGTEWTPKGLRHWALPANVKTMTATPDTDKVEADLGALSLALRNANVRFLRPGWIFAPRTEEALFTARDKQGNWLYRPEMLLGQLRSFPYKSTTNIPINLGAGQNESEIYLADFADVAIGEVPEVVVDISSVGAYHDGANVVSAFSLDQTVVKVVMENDLALRHPESVAVLTGVTWAAPIAQPA